MSGTKMHAAPILTALPARLLRKQCWDLLMTFALSFVNRWALNSHHYCPVPKLFWSHKTCIAESYTHDLLVISACSRKEVQDKTIIANEYVLFGWLREWQQHQRDFSDYRVERLGPQSNDACWNRVLGRLFQLLCLHITRNSPVPRPLFRSSSVVLFGIIANSTIIHGFSR